MITEDYVSFETAKLLKEKGFNEPCRLYYDKYHGYVPIFVEDSKLTEYGYKELVRNDQDSISDFIASAPSLYVVMKWLREVHNQIIVPNVRVEDPISGIINCYIVGIWYIPKNNGGSLCFISPTPENGYSTYEEACEAAVKYCLENLI